MEARNGSAGVRPDELITLFAPLEEPGDMGGTAAGYLQRRPGGEKHGDRRDVFRIGRQRKAPLPSTPCETRRQTGCFAATLKLTKTELLLSHEDLPFPRTPSLLRCQAPLEHLLQLSNKIRMTEGPASVRAGSGWHPRLRWLP